MSESDNNKSEKHDWEKHWKEFLKSQKKQARDWKKILEDRNKFDNKNYQDLFKSWAQTWIDVSSANVDTMKEIQKMQIHSIDAYIDGIDEIIKDETSEPKRKS